MTIRFGSLCVTQAVEIQTVDGNNAVGPIDGTGFTLSAKWYDSGHVGAFGSREDYGTNHDGCDPLLTLTSETGGGVVIDVVNPLTVHLELTPAMTRQLADNSMVETRRKRRLVYQIWRTNTGAESMLFEATEYAQP